MLKIVRTTSFKKDWKKQQSRNKDLNKLKKTIIMLASEMTLPANYRLHKLSGDFCDCLECHIEPDWLLIFQILIKEEIIVLIRTGTHSDLF